MDANSEAIAVMRRRLARYGQGVVFRDEQEVQNAA